MATRTKTASKKSTRQTISVVQMTERGKRVRQFKSISAASLATEVNSGSIYNVAVLGKGKTAGGFRWKTLN